MRTATATGLIAFMVLTIATFALQVFVYIDKPQYDVAESRQMAAQKSATSLLAARKTAVTPRHTLFQDQATNGMTSAAGYGAGVPVSPSPRVNEVAFSPDGKLLASA